MGYRDTESELRDQLISGKQVCAFLTTVKSGQAREAVL